MSGLISSLTNVPEDIFSLVSKNTLGANTWRLLRVIDWPRVSLGRPPPWALIASYCSLVDEMHLTSGVSNPFLEPPLSDVENALNELVQSICPQLRALTMNAFQIDPKQKLANAKVVKHLTLGRAWGFSVELMKLLQQGCPNLRTLYLEDAAMFDTSANEFKQLILALRNTGSLEVVELRVISISKSFFDGSCAEDLKAIFECNQNTLKNFNLVGTRTACLLDAFFPGEADLDPAVIFQRLPEICKINMAMDPSVLRINGNSLFSLALDEVSHCPPADVSMSLLERCYPHSPVEKYEAIHYFAVNQWKKVRDPIQHCERMMEMIEADPSAVLFSCPSLLMEMVVILEKMLSSSSDVSLNHPMSRRMVALLELHECPIHALVVHREVPFHFVKLLLMDQGWCSKIRFDINRPCEDGRSIVEHVFHQIDVFRVAIDFPGLDLSRATKKKTVIHNVVRLCSMYHGPQVGVVAAAISSHRSRQEREALISILKEKRTLGLFFESEQIRSAIVPLVGVENLLQDRLIRYARDHNQMHLVVEMCHSALGMTPSEDLPPHIAQRLIEKRK